MDWFAFDILVLVLLYWGTVGVRAIRFRRRMRNATSSGCIKRNMFAILVEQGVFSLSRGNLFQN